MNPAEGKSGMQICIVWWQNTKRRIQIESMWWSDMYLAWRSLWNKKLLPRKQVWQPVPLIDMNEGRTDSEACLLLRNDVASRKPRWILTNHGKFLQTRLSWIESPLMDQSIDPSIHPSLEIDKRVTLVVAHSPHSHEKSLQRNFESMPEDWHQPAATTVYLPNDLIETGSGGICQVILSKGFDLQNDFILFCSTPWIASCWRRTIDCCSFAKRKRGVELWLMYSIFRVVLLE